MNSVRPRSFWKNRPVLVTGVTGMVGGNLVRELLGLEAMVVGLVRDANPQSELWRSEDYRKISIVNGGLEDFATVERAISEYGIKTVFHLAAQPLVEMAVRSPLETFEANIRGTYHILEACRIHSALVSELVVASSDKAYGEKSDLPYLETMSLEGVYPYEVSKSCADLLAQSYYRTYGLKLAITRCGNIYGPGDLNWSRLIPGTIRSFLFDERPLLRSDGKHVRDYIYVQDVCEAMLLTAEKLTQPGIAGQAFNFSPEKPYTVMEIVETLAKLMDCRHLKPVIENRATGEIPSQYLDATKAAKLLHWKPRFSLARGLASTLKWYETFFGTLSVIPAEAA